MNWPRQTSGIALYSAIFLLGCGGGHGSLAANGAKYPVSMSNGVRNSDGALLGDDDLKQVGRVKSEYHAWSMFWNMIPLSGEHDISDEINSQVQAAGGEAVVGLEVTSSNCTWNFFSLIGILPDCASVAVEGRIVKRNAADKQAPQDPKANALSPASAKEVSNAKSDLQKTADAPAPAATDAAPPVQDKPSVP